MILVNGVNYWQLPGGQFSWGEHFSGGKFSWEGIYLGGNFLGGFFPVGGGGGGEEGRGFAVVCDHGLNQCFLSVTN